MKRLKEDEEVNFRWFAKQWRENTKNTGVADSRLLFSTWIKTVTENHRGVWQALHAQLEGSYTQNMTFCTSLPRDFDISASGDQKNFCVNVMSRSTPHNRNSLFGCVAFALLSFQKEDRLCPTLDDMHKDETSLTFTLKWEEDKRGDPDVKAFLNTFLRSMDMTAIQIRPF